MVSLGNIGSSYDRYNTLYQLSLEREVSTVDTAEAENGAAQSDSFRAANKRNSEDERVPLSNFTKRVAQFSQLVKKEAGKKDDVEKSSCPVEKARAESAVGMNAPLNWLVADHMGGQVSTPTRQDFAGDTPEIDFQSPAALFVAEPSLSQEEPSDGTLLSQEWLLTPCA